MAKNDTELMTALHKIAVKLENDIRGELAKQKHIASGKLSNSIDVNEVRYSKEYGIEIRAAHYGKYIDEGRRPTNSSGTGELKHTLVQWIRDKQSMGGFKDVTEKNIKGVAYVIARKIHREGTLATRTNDTSKMGFISDTVTRNLDYISSRLLKASGDRLSIDLFSVIGNKGKGSKFGMDIELAI